MNSRCSKLVGLFVGLAAILALPLAYLGSQEKLDKPKPKEKEEVIETRGEVGKKQRYPVKEAKNDPKGGKIEKRAGAYTCDVHFDNRTRWIIHRMFVDRALRARNMQPVGDVYVYDVISGPTELYAEADFTDGSIRYWGPQMVSCPSYVTFRWELH
ncbi:MAG: hypothetical protein HYT78_04880 [Deltaproteobacteria bacterium]|nr:hypothetical protein [Deltaproteobacteria bacterium]